MKKTICLMLLLLAAVVGVLFLENKEMKVHMVDGTETPFEILLQYDLGEIKVKPWYHDERDVWYLFFPSYIKNRSIDCSYVGQELYIDGQNVRKDFSWQDDWFYEVVLGEAAFRVCFMEDKNLSTLFIETESGSNELMREAKENVEKGHIISLDQNGNIQYGGKIKELSGHGNAWEFYDKRAYDIKLNNKASLAGIDGGNHWKLLHLWNDGDKIHSKLAFDIADILQADYTPDCNWVNVYFNGEYHGMYLLTTAVRDHEVFRSDNIVFLEKDLSGRYEQEEHVITGEGNPFVIHRPRTVTETKKEEILHTVQRVEDSIVSGELDESLIDVNSFVNQFLVDEISLNSDGFETSTYVYKLTETSPLAAGPAWDYDAGFGEAMHMDVSLSNPAGEVLDGEKTELTWYAKLYENPEFVRRVAERFSEISPALKSLYNEEIDTYAEYIKVSVRNDDIRWKSHFETNPRTGNYQTWDNNLRYLKYFCINRFNALQEKWNIEGEKLAWEGNGTEHTITVLYDGKKESVKVKDGERLTEDKLGEFFQKDRCRGRYVYSEEEYSSYLPVLEDFSVKLEISPGVGENESCKYVDISKNMYYKTFDYVSVLIVDSNGNTESVLSAEPLDQDIHLEFPKEETGIVAIYVFSDETASEVLDEVVINY